MLEFWFPIPIWSFNINLKEKNFSEAINYCLKFSKENEGVSISNVGGWHSKDFIVSTHNHSESHIPIYELFFNIFKHLQICKGDLDIPDNLNFLLNAWINVNYKNHFNKRHCHGFKDVLSGTLYLTKNNSKIIFYKNRDFMEATILNSYSNRTNYLTYNKVEYKPQQGDLLIFPTWLEHEVETNFSDEPRISLAFNAELSAL